MKQVDLLKKISIEGGGTKEDIKNYLSKNESKSIKLLKKWSGE